MDMEYRLNDCDVCGTTIYVGKHRSICPMCDKDHSAPLSGEPPEGKTDAERLEMQKAYRASQGYRVGTLAELNVKPGDVVTDLRGEYGLEIGERIVSMLTQTYMINDAAPIIMSVRGVNE